MSETKASLKLLVDSTANKVLFAEAGKDFVDFLFHILSLPVATVVKLLDEDVTVGSLGTVYRSMESLSADYFQPNLDKQIVLKSSAIVPLPIPLLGLNEGSTRKRIYRCELHKKYVSDDLNAICPDCGEKMCRKSLYISAKNDVKDVTSTYMVMDNLEVKSMSNISGISLIKELRVKDLLTLVEKQVQVGLIEGLAMLTASFEVDNNGVLTTVFLSKKA